MSSEGGLTRRRKVHNTDNSGSSGTTNTSEPGVNEYNEKDTAEVEDADSKETRLTLMEEVLLLGIKDKEVMYLKLSQWRP